MTTLARALAAFGLLLAMSPSAADAGSPRLFGTVEFRAASLAALPQWQRTLGAIERERGTYETCRRDVASCPSRGAHAWLAMIDAQRDRTPVDQIDRVNRFLNKWQYEPDSSNYGRRDYWASPLEFLRRSGDCEDYAIIKYVSLRELGFSAEQLRVVVVKDTVRDIAHAVLAVYLDGEVYILDNLTPTVRRQDSVTRYVPYYSINETTRWAHVSPLNRLVSQVAESPTPSSPQRRGSAGPSSQAGR